MFISLGLFTLVVTVSYASSLSSFSRVVKEISNDDTNTADISFCEPNSNPSATAVTLFRTYFAREALSRELLKQLLNVEDHLSPKEFARGFFYLSTSLFSHLRGTDATQNAHLITRFMATCVNRLSSHTLTHLTSSSPANYLYSEGVLDKQNAKSLGEKFASILENVASVVMDDKYPLTKVATIFIGHATFLSSLCLFSPGNFNKISTMFGTEWSFLIPEKGDEEPILSSWISDSNPLMTNTNIPCWIAPEVTVFSDAFCNSTRTSHVMKYLFRSSSVLTPEETAKGVFYLTLFHHFYHRISKPALFADFTARFVRQLPTLKWHQFARAYANIAGKFLFFEGLLNEGNALLLAQDLVQTTEKMAKELVTVRDARSKIVARSFGLTQFVFNMGLFTEEKLPKLTFHVGNEWRCQLLNQTNASISVK